MTLPFLRHRIVRELLGAFAGMAIAGVLYMGFREYSFLRYRGAIVEPQVTLSVTNDSAQSQPSVVAAVSDDIAAKLEERNRKRLTAIAYRQEHPAPVEVSVTSDDPAATDPVSAAQEQAPPSDAQTSPPVTVVTQAAEAASPSAPVPQPSDGTPMVVDAYGSSKPLPASGPGMVFTLIVAALGGTWSVRRGHWQRLPQRPPATV